MDSNLKPGDRSIGPTRLGFWELIMKVPLGKRFIVKVYCKCSRSINLYLDTKSLVASW